MLHFSSALLDRLKRCRTTDLICHPLSCPLAVASVLVHSDTWDHHICICLQKADDDIIISVSKTHWQHKKQNKIDTMWQIIYFCFGFFCIIACVYVGVYHLGGECNMWPGGSGALSDRPFDAPVPLLFSPPANLVARNKHFFFPLLARNTCSRDGMLCAPFEYLKSPQRYHIWKKLNNPFPPLEISLWKH